MNKNQAPLVWFALILIAPLAVISPAFAETIKLRNGRTLEGKVLTVAGGYVIVETGGIQVNLQQSEVIPPDLAKLLQQAEQQFQKGNNDRAREFCAQIRTWSPQDKGALDLLARIDKSEEEARAKAEEVRIAREARITQAREALSMGDFETARKVADAVLKEDPENAAAKQFLPEIDQAIVDAKAKSLQMQELRDKNIRAANEALRSKDTATALNLVTPLVERFPRDEQLQSIILQVAKLVAEQSPATTETVATAGPTSSDLAAIIAQINAPTGNSIAGPPVAAVKKLEEELGIIAAQIHAAGGRPKIVTTPTTPQTTLTTPSATVATTKPAAATPPATPAKTPATSAAAPTTGPLSIASILEGIKKNDQKIQSLDLSFTAATEIPKILLLGQQQGKQPSAISMTGQTIYGMGKHLTTVQVNTSFKDAGKETNEASNLVALWDGTKGSLVVPMMKSVLITKNFGMNGVGPLTVGMIVGAEKDNSGIGMASLTALEWSYAGQEVIAGRNCAIIDGALKTDYSVVAQRLWIDTERGFRPVKRDSSISLIVGNPPKRIITDSTLQVLEMKEIKPGIWMPTQTQETTYLTEPPAAKRKIADVTMKLTVTALNQPVEAKTFVLNAPADFKTTDMTNIPLPTDQLGAEPGATTATAATAPTTGTAAVAPTTGTAPGAPANRPLLDTRVPAHKRKAGFGRPGRALPGGAGVPGAAGVPGGPTGAPATPPTPPAQ